MLKYLPICSSAPLSTLKYAGSFLSLSSFPVLLYFLYRWAACSKLEWECRAKSSRQTFEDISSLLLLSCLLYTLANFEPCEEKPNLVGRDSSGESEDFELIHSSVKPHHSSRETHRGTQTIKKRRMWESANCSLFLRPLIIVSGVLAALITCFCLGKLGEEQALAHSVEQRELWNPPGVYVMAPMLGLIGVALLLSFYFSFRAGPREVFVYLAVLGATLAYHLGAWAVSKVGRPNSLGNKCNALVFHPHHYALAFFAILLLRCHGLSYSSSKLQQSASLFVYTVKCSLAGVFVQGLAQYGADSILRSTSCAVD